MTHFIVVGSVGYRSVTLLVTLLRTEILLFSLHTLSGVALRSRVLGRHVHKWLRRGRDTEYRASGCALRACRVRVHTSSVTSFVGIFTLYRDLTFYPALVRRVHKWLCRGRDTEYRTSGCALRA